jgi:hypothetical protein
MVGLEGWCYGRLRYESTIQRTWTGLTWAGYGGSTIVSRIEVRLDTREQGVVTVDIFNTEGIPNGSHQDREITLIESLLPGILRLSAKDGKL